MEELCSKIRGNYDSVSKHITIRAKKRMIAEVEVLARKGESVDLYEVKCSPRLVKAKRQLRKLNKYLGIGMKISNCYFYCGSSHSIMAVLPE